MHTFEELAVIFSDYFSRDHFPQQPTTLYDPNRYFLSIGGKRVRPVLCLLANELFGELHPDALNVAVAIELFHNFTLIHDDIMDKAPLRRGKITVHEKYNENTAILAGDVMLIKSYEYINRLEAGLAKEITELVSKTGAEVCEGQQLDLDFETADHVSYEEYLEMIKQKTSVLLAACLKAGGILAGTTVENLESLYQVGINIGLAFQVQDDYLDAFGDPGKFGKKTGGDIIANKKTFLLIEAMERARGKDLEQLNNLLQSDSKDKVDQMLLLYDNLGVKEWAEKLKGDFLQKALYHVDAIKVDKERKSVLKELATRLISREN